MNLFEEFRRSTRPITIDEPRPALGALLSWTTMTKERISESPVKDQNRKEHWEALSPDPDGLSLSTSNF